MSSNGEKEVLVLAIDTSSRRRVVCVLASALGGLVRGVVEDDVDIDRALPPALQSLVSDAVTHVAVVTGPGSYTGVRAGMAAALGLAHARGLPLYGVSSLVPVWCAAHETGAENGWAVAEAGRGAVYVMPFSSGTGAATAAGPWPRVDLTALATSGRRLYSADPLPVDGLQRVDPVVGLALAVPHALCRPLRLDALRAEYGGSG